MRKTGCLCIRTRRSRLFDGMQRETIVEGRVAYDVENDEWVMFVEDRFADMADVYTAVNRLLAERGDTPLRAGDELEISLRRAPVKR
jgi:hypothetical protein